MWLNWRRGIIALIIILITYVYFRYFGITAHYWAHAIFGVIILGSLVIAFLTRKRDVTIGILYGLVMVLCTLMVKFFVFVNVE